MVAVYVKSYNTFVFMFVQYYLYIVKNLMTTSLCSCDMNVIGDACKFTMKRTSVTKWWSSTHTIDYFCLRA